MEFFAAYSTGVIALLIFVLIVLLQSALVGAGKANAGLTPGSNPAADYDNSLYRLHRAHQNGTEIVGMAAISLVAAVIAGLPAAWVNWLMVAFLLTRIIYALIYARSIGRPTQGIRTGVFVAGWAILVLLCVWSIISLI